MNDYSDIKTIIRTTNELCYCVTDCELKHCGVIVFNRLMYFLNFLINIRENFTLYILMTAEQL